jgi:hypothetical protein
LVELRGLIGVTKGEAAPIVDAVNLSDLTAPNGYFP